MIGEMKEGLYRIMEGTNVRFFRVHPNSDNVMSIVELEHVDGSAREIKDTKTPLTEEIWLSLIPWQGMTG